jgi:hypothetical protein
LILENFFRDVVFVLFPFILYPTGIVVEILPLFVFLMEIQCFQRLKSCSRGLGGRSLVVASFGAIAASFNAPQRLWVPCRSAKSLIPFFEQYQEN